jgi:hypothetical protein
MALTYNQVARQTGNQRTLQKAGLLYGKVIDMTTAMPSMQVGDDIYMLELVARNNCASIEYALQITGACTESLSTVREMVNAIARREGIRSQSGAAAKDHRTFILPGHFDEIVLNTIVHTTPVSAPTA